MFRHSLGQGGEEDVAWRNGFLDRHGVFVIRFWKRNGKNVGRDERQEKQREKVLIHVLRL